MIDEFEMTWSSFVSFVGSSIFSFSIHPERAVYNGPIKESSIGMILHAEGDQKMGFCLLTRNDYLLAFGVLKI